MGIFKSGKGEFSEEDRESFISPEYADQYIKKPKYEEPDISEDVVTGAVEDEEDTCDICGSKLGFFSKNKVARNLYICNDCADKSGIMRHLKEVKKLPAETIERIIIKKIYKAKGFVVTKSVDKYFFVDEEMEMWTIPYITGLTRNKANIDPEEIYPFEIIEEYFLIDDGKIIAGGGKKHEPINGLLLAGNVAADAEPKCSSLQIKINIDNISGPSVFVDLIAKPTDRSGGRYNMALVSAQKILGILEDICQREAAGAGINVPIYDPETEVIPGIEVDNSRDAEPESRFDNVKILNVDEINRRLHPTKRERYKRPAESTEVQEQKEDMQSEDSTRVFNPVSKAEVHTDTGTGKRGPYYRQPGFSVTEEIKKYKELLDMGAITEEEYNAKKKQLLEL